MARFSVRERGEKSGTVLIVSDWCILLASLTPPYTGMGGQGFHHLGGCRGHRALIIRPSPQLPLGHAGHRLTLSPQIKTLNTSYQEWDVRPESYQIALY